MQEPQRTRTIQIVLALEGILLGAIGIWLGHADDAPGAGLIGLLLTFAFLCAAWRAGRRLRKAPGRRANHG